MLFFKPRKTIDLKAAYETAVENVRQAQTTIETMDLEPFSLKAGRRGSVRLSMRMSAAMASVIKGKLERGKTQLTMQADQDLAKVLLGRQATELRIYDRDFRADMVRIGLTPNA